MRYICQNDSFRWFIKGINYDKAAEKTQDMHWTPKQNVILDILQLPHLLKHVKRKQIHDNAVLFIFGTR